MDLGCVKMRLKDMHSISRYIPVDYCDSKPGTQFCDYNNKECMNEVVDYSSVIRCLEYIVDPKWFVTEIARISNTCIISYHTTDNIADIKTRRKFYWLNNLSRANIIELFREFHMYIKNETLRFFSNNIFLFGKEEG